ncbi:MAG TPA: ATP-binding cassette domain-containing protein [Alphaproteobacteria bacterium]|nr:ATP-binding cassette domain-containing protein [Alphaproteobacteria bacterium]
MANEATGALVRSRGAPLAHARGVVKRINGRIILAGIDLVVGAGEIVTVIGPNGAGKTMLLRVLLGLERCEEGEASLAAGLRVGYMPQRLHVEGTMPLPVRRFLALGGPVGRPAIAAVLDEVGAAEVIDAPIQRISGGEFQRVLLARALLRDPDLLVLDEPAQGVDVAGQSELFELIVKIRDRRGCGVLMVSHDLHLVMAATDTVLCINQHVCCTGRPEAVSRDPAYLALFGPRAVAQLAPYTHHHDHAHDVGGRVVSLAGASDAHDRDHGHGHDHG